MAISLGETVENWKFVDSLYVLGNVYWLSVIEHVHRCVKYGKEGTKACDLCLGTPISLLTGLLMPEDVPPWFPAR
jgi:hypothetical protein